LVWKKHRGRYFKFRFNRGGDPPIEAAGLTESCNYVDWGEARNNIESLLQEKVRDIHYDWLGVLRENGC
jgi:hypothetical protein